MTDIHNIHNIIAARLQKHLSLSRVSLKHPFPARPLRTLGLVSLNGEVYTSDKLLRVVCLRVSLPAYFKVYSTFIRPKTEYDLPVLSCEAILTGKKRILVLDIHGTGDDHAAREDTAFLLFLSE